MSDRCSGDIDEEKSSKDPHSIILDRRVLHCLRARTRARHRKYGIKTFNKASELHCGLEFYVILPKVNRLVKRVILTMLKIMPVYMYIHIYMYIRTANCIHFQALAAGTFSGILISGAHVIQILI